MFPINDKAYQFELIENNCGLFDDGIINTTYIIHLENNGRVSYKFKIYV